MRTLRTVPVVLLILVSEGLAQSPTDGKISGQVFADYFYNVARDTGFSALSNTALNGAKDLHGFKLRRFYLTYDKSISEVFAMRFRLEADEASNTSNGKIGTFVKDAYLEWKEIFSGSDMVIGIQPTPAFEVSEAVWGYRSIEKTAMDLWGIVSSRDQGVSLNGKIMDDGMLNYKVMIGNGSSNSPETNKYKKYYARVESTPFKKLVVTAYADLAARGTISTPAGPIANNSLTVAGFVGFRETDVFSIGLEGFMQSMENGFVQAGSYSARSALSISAFGSFTIHPKMKLLARIDSFDPNSNSAATGDSRIFAVAGIDWQPDGKVSIIPNILIESYDNRAGVAVDPSVTARVTVAYSF